EQALDFTLRRPMALLVGANGDRAAEPAADQLDELADRDVVAAADVDDSAQRGFAAGDGDETGDGVFHIGQVAARVEAAQLHLGTGEGLADDRRYDRAGRLPGAECVERPENRQGQPEG